MILILQGRNIDGYEFVHWAKMFTKMKVHICRTLHTGKADSTLKVIAIIVVYIVD